MCLSLNVISCYSILFFYFYSISYKKNKVYGLSVAASMRSGIYLLSYVVMASFRAVSVYLCSQTNVARHKLDSHVHQEGINSSKGLSGKPTTVVLQNERRHRFPS